MAGGLSGVLALQGVFPVAAPASAAPPGLTLGQLTGVWITGAPSGVVVIPGLSLGQLSGVWLSGAPIEVPLSDYPSGGYLERKLPGEDYRERIARDDMDILALVIAAIESGIIE